MRSASSVALRSASAKSTGAAFFAPSPPNFAFFAPPAAAGALLVLPRDVADELRREAPSLEAGRAPAPVVVLARRDAELTVRGAVVALAERPMTGGAVGLEDVGGDLGVAGLSQEEKKSSSSPPAAAGFAVGSAPSTVILSGNLGAFYNTALGETKYILTGQCPV